MRLTLRLTLRFTLRSHCVGRPIRLMRTIGSSALPRIKTFCSMTRLHSAKHSIVFVCTLKQSQSVRHLHRLCVTKMIKSTKTSLALAVTLSSGEGCLAINLWSGKTTGKIIAAYARSWREKKHLNITSPRLIPYQVEVRVNTSSMPKQVCLNLSQDCLCPKQAKRKATTF